MYYSLKKVAEMLDVSLSTVRYWVSVGKLKAHKAGRLVKIKKEDLEEFIKER